MRTKNAFISAFIIFSICSASLVLGQQQQWQKKTPEERAENQTAWMQKNLFLTQGQEKKVHDIILYYAQETDSMMSMPRGKEKKAERENIERDRDGELKTVLTPDQYQKYQAHVSEMKQKMKQRMEMQGEGGNY